jgi:acetate kinase
MADAILVLNAGSSSLKFSIFLDADSLLLHGLIECLLTEPHFVARNAQGSTLGEKRWPAGTALGHAGAVAHLFAWMPECLTGHRLVAAGHRVVHGGVRFTGPARIDAGVLAELERLIPLAPLHQPHHIAAIRSVAERAPELPQVACFDTSFHRTQSAVAQSFALPRRFAAEGVRRYGFHGLSYEYIAADERAAHGRTVVAHLGNGASMCGMYDGHCVATTMSFTPLDGLMMGTRCGTVDPAVLLYLMNQHGMDARQLEKLLWNESGLLGVSEISSDMRALLASADPRAAEAIDLFVYRIGRELGSLAAALGGLDTLVFTGGIGENASAIRARVCQDARWLGLEIDTAANQAGGPRLSRPGSAVTAWVIATNEELMIARHTQRLLDIQT